MMPRLDGLELCRRIRAEGGDRYTYIILLTSRNLREDRLEGLRAGADDFLTKPPDPDELAVRLEIAGRILNLYEQLALQERSARRPGHDRRADRREKPPAIPRRPGASLRPGGSSRLAPVDSSCSTSITSKNTTTRSATRPVTRFSAGSVRSCRTSVRAHDVVARYGGEEFVVLMPATQANEALEVAERLRAAIAYQPWPLRKVTASLGVATTAHSTSNAAALVDQADQALYQSKQAGRDQGHSLPLPCQPGRPDPLKPDHRTGWQGSSRPDRLSRRGATRRSPNATDA